MRVEVEFSTKKNEFPLEYRRVVMSYLKSSVQNCNGGKYMDEYYEAGQERRYSFAVFFDKPKYLEDRIELNSGKVKMVFTTADKLTGFVFYSAFLESRNKVVPLKNDNELTVVKVRELKQRVVTDDEALFKLISPLCVRKHKHDTNQDYYYSYEREGFREVFLHVVKKQLRNAGFAEEYLQEIDIIPISCRKVIVKHYECKIECTIGTIVLKGNKSILQYLLNSGMCSRRSEGFGTLELLTNG